MHQMHQMSRLRAEAVSDEVRKRDDSLPENMSSGIKLVPTWKKSPMELIEADKLTSELHGRT